MISLGKGVNGMQVGDIVFFKGDSFISKLVHLVTGSPYTHVAIAMSHDTILEADAFIKVRIRPIGDHEVYKVMRYKGITKEQQDTIFAGGMSYIGVKYDYLSVFMWLIRLVTNYKGNGIVNNANQVYCSELTDRLYDLANIDLVPARPDGDVLPEYLLNSPLLTEVYST